MNKKSLIVSILTIFCVTIALVGCSYTTPTEEKTYEIPEQNIKYIGFEFGNVIQDGKRAVFFNFKSDYSVVKIEFAGNLLDVNGETIYSFDTCMNFSQARKDPTPTIRIDKDLIYKVSSVSFTKTIAYTNETISSD